ncbi:hypothetical protein [Corynebacterium heidelbergense]|uniref:Uncharacterized protein n=1 Tax=Corynebacterium heidelbergense TaxID=2055947 RepID=A0A364V3P9_9CORY|nr:hypothetical protein [Corynebacterium heidelbergense]RAV31257.1 hypothetical protein DLJ54_09305 [Corynebacterium heidelbergense]
MKSRRDYNLANAIDGVPLPDEPPEDEDPDPFSAAPPETGSPEPAPAERRSALDIAAELIESSLGAKRVR